MDARVKLLFESRELLNNILVKYPQSELGDKVKRNLMRIEEEIMAIDPSLLLTSAGDDDSHDSDAGQNGQVFEGEVQEHTEKQADTEGFIRTQE